MAREIRPLILRFLPLVIVPACVLFSAAQAGGRATVLVSARPDLLVVYNRYQQRLTSIESGALLPYEPMIVIEEDATLGDGFTRCAAVHIRGESYYLLRGKDGALPAGLTAYRDVEVLVDTIRILPGRNVVVESPDRSSRRPVSGGQVFVRLFRHNGSLFVRQSGERPPLVGWIREQGAADSGWERIHPPAPSTRRRTISEARSVVDAEVDGINRMLHALYSGQGKSGGDAIPRLVVEEFGDSLCCRLFPPGAVRAYRGALEVLAAHLGKKLASRDMTSVPTPAGVTVRSTGSRR